MCESGVDLLSGVIRILNATMSVASVLRGFLRIEISYKILAALMLGLSSARVSSTNRISPIFSKCSLRQSRSNRRLASFIFI